MTLSNEYLKHALSFLKASKVLHVHVNELRPHKIAPVYFNITHTFELLFKAYLLNKGYTGVDIKKMNIRHDLIALLNSCEEIGFNISFDDKLNIEQLNSYTKEHEFRYPTVGDKIVPNEDELLSLAQRIHDALKVELESLETA